MNPTGRIACEVGSSLKNMKRLLLLSLLLLHGCASTTSEKSTMLAVAPFAWIDRDIDRIVDGGSFDRSFSKGIYPYKEAEIERWFRSVLPIGISKERARQILDSSFSIDLTSGKKVVIEKESGMAGGRSTQVFLRFEEGKFRDVAIDQQWSYL